MKKLFFLALIVFGFNSDLFGSARKFVGRSLFNSSKKLDFSSPAIKRHLLYGIKEQAEVKSNYNLTIKAGHSYSIYLPEISNWSSKTEQEKFNLLDIDGILKYDKGTGKHSWVVTFYPKPVKEITTVEVKINYKDFIHVAEQFIDCMIEILPE